MPPPARWVHVNAPAHPAHPVIVVVTEEPDAPHHVLVAAGPVGVVLHDDGVRPADSRIVRHPVMEIVHMKPVGIVVALPPPSQVARGIVLHGVYGTVYLAMASQHPHRSDCE